MRALIFLIAIFPFGSVAADGPAPREERDESMGMRFYDRKAEGWWWKEKIPEPPDEDEVVVEAPPPPAPEPPKAAEAPEPALDPLSPAWFRANYKEMLDDAVNDPTPDKVRAVLYLQRVMMDKSSRYARTVQVLTKMDPFLNESFRQPGGTAYREMTGRVRNQRQVQLMKDIAKRAGFLFFFAGEERCPECLIQARTMQAYETLYGFEVLAISLDGEALPEGLFPDYKRDQGHSDVLGVQAAPAIVLVEPPERFLPVSYGLVSLKGLMDRILVIGRESGWISHEEFDRVMIYASDDSLLPANIGDRLSEADMADPQRLVEVLREAAKDTVR